MCCVDNCFRSLGPTASRNEKVSHYTSKALCYLALGLISGVCLMTSAYSVIMPLTLAESVSLAVYATLTVAAFVKMVIDGRKAWEASPEPQVPATPIANGESR